MNELFSKIEGFDWDEGNLRKNWERHGVIWNECEEAFLDSNSKIMKDVLHSQKEARYIFLGKTLTGRLLYIIFTLRKNKIRIVSARDINKKECFLYEKVTKNPKF